MKKLSSSDADLHIAGEALKAGLLVAFPTETVYGLGGDGFNRYSLARIFEAKKRPRFDPLIIHIAEMDALDRVVHRDALPFSLREKTSVLSETLWPGPLTLVLPKRPEVPDLATSGLNTVAVRFPSHPVAQKVIAYSTCAVAAPSANPFGYLSPTRAEHIEELLGDEIDFIVDAGSTDIGIESTVLDLTQEPVRLLRPGGMPRERIEELIGKIEDLGNIREAPTGAPQAPGMLSSHYAPKTPLVLLTRDEMLRRVVSGKDAGPCVYLFFDGKTREESDVITDTVDRAIFTLSERGDCVEAAANLFDLLHRIDRLSKGVIYAQRAPERGLGTAINDRLSRASVRGTVQRGCI
ncbi:MAG: threonylcarbamoyl-AMP synthase [Treponema sp.]|jgi:L-threonylcarbamoyladenylate synthase|nr:threonylcarbamoyl-AMP synthase [Treponema sp.]